MNRRLQDWLIQSADRTPEAPAIVFKGESTSYAALEEASNRLARALRDAGCTRGDRVALLLPKSPQALIAMFAALKADCIYVPLDTSSPAERLGRILAVCEPSCILAVESTAAALEALAPFAKSAWSGFLDDTSGVRAHFRWNDLNSFCGARIESQNKEEDAAHILFTSGSTGVPKGVVITHSNVLHFIDWAIRYFGIRASDKISGHPPLHFDLSTFDIYSAIAAGAQIHLLTPEMSLLPHRLAEFIRASELTQWFSVPSILNHMARNDVLRPNDFPALERLLWCGEKFPTPGLIYWMRHVPHARFVNLYGPTEATIASSYYHVAQCPGESAEIPIGEPCAGELLLVLDAQLRPAPVNEIGDLYIGGTGLSPGYWKDPEKTQQVFLQNPFTASPSGRIYKTGDLARIGPDGMIYLVGRSDTQIKTRGYRVELGEIETAIHTIPGIKDAAVVAVDGEGFEGLAICCAYVPAAGFDLTPKQLRQHLTRSLPSYMIPSRWMELDRLPLNGNGKIARPLLKQQFQNETETAVSGGRPA